MIAEAMTAARPRREQSPQRRQRDILLVGRTPRTTPDLANAGMDRIGWRDSKVGYFHPNLPDD